MERKRFNWILIIGSVIFVTLIGWIMSFARLKSLSPFLGLLVILCMSVGIFGLLNFTKLFLWIKLVLAVIFGMIFIYVSMFLMTAIFGGM